MKSSHSMPWRLGIAVLLLILGLLSASLGGWSNNRSDSEAYWIWAGLIAQDAPPNSDLYVFQGRVWIGRDTVRFEHLGLYPHPIKCRKLFLVYRLEGALPGAEGVVDLFTRGAAQWQRHHISITGLQLDYDCPTARLADYGRFLTELKKRLPRGCTLSITGLCDWVTSGDDEAIRSIASSADEVAFQLYQGRDLLPDIEGYVSELAAYPGPFRVGLVAGPVPPSVSRLKSNYYYRGIIYFLRRGA
jgi:hypothetical protein